MANPRNERMVEELRGLLASAESFYLVDYQGLSAHEMGELRQKVRSSGGQIFVAKNTLINVVLKENGVEGFDETLNGPTALVLVGSDPVEPAKALTDYAKDHAKDLPVPKGGYLKGSMLDASGISRVAKLPSRDQLKAELVGVLQAPLTQLVGVLEASPRNLVAVINNYADKLKEDA